jgi:S-adenosylmethionine-diacylglycerol 3-amino-3-carboxypropyl transferase
MFGQGRLPDAKSTYQSKLRSHLPEWSQSFWDKKIKWFDHKKRSFYFRSTSGVFARMMNHYVDKVIRIRPVIDRLLAAQTVEEQKQIYENELRDKFWTGLVKFTMNRDTTLSMLGVPKAQRRQLETQYEGGIIQYCKDSIHAVCAELPLHDNYFWRVYINGCYTRECCPNYLIRENFEKLKAGLIDRLTTTTNSVQGFLENCDQPISRFVLLDHMDWLSDHFFPMLEAEWQAIVNRAAPNARVIWRSGGLKTDFVNQVQIHHEGQLKKITELLSYNKKLAAELHPKDRVHTYASFYIADLSA